MSFRRSASAFLGAVFLSIGLITPLVSAQQGGSGLQLSPTRTEVSVNPGEAKEITITLKNITTGDLSAVATLNDFESDNVSGTPKILIDSKSRTPYSISSMLRNLQDVDIKAGETKEIKLTIDTPGNAAPGAYFGAVRYSVVPKGATQSERQIALNASVAHLVFVEVPGNVNQQIKVESLKMLKDDKPGSIFFAKPDKSALAIKNLGNGFSRPFGKVTISNPFNKEVHSYDVNSAEQRSIVLPNSSRTFTDNIKGVGMPGRYKATASVAYGNGGEVVTYKSTFWYLPGWFLALLALLFVGAIGGGYTMYRKRYAGAKPVKKAKVQPKVKITKKRK